ncbi:MAG: hypothetical protein K0S78_1278 [Thermomicrobiales bacterium]|jgi:uncharacterized membrane protein YhaH (DUF805 family)|nr:hypothetical protein [Thermomicrobiales bacterium]
MGFSEAIRSGFANAFTFSGRASRREYWWWALFQFLTLFAAAILDLLLWPDSARWMPFGGVLAGLVTVVLLVPTLAVSVRRLHDTDRSGWWYLLVFIPIVGAIVLLVFFLGQGTPGTNRFGPPPRRTRSVATLGPPPVHG